MPIRLPVAHRAQARPLRTSSKPFDRSCAVIGAAAILLAAFINWGCKERAGAVLVLLMAGGLVAVLLRGPGRGRNE